MKIATFKNGKQDYRHFQNSMAIPPKYEYYNCRIYGPEILLWHINPMRRKISVGRGIGVNVYIFLF